MLSTTITCDDGSVIPVKTSIAIPKEKIFDCMEIINSFVVSLPIKKNDVIINNIANTSADVISTVNKTI